MLLGIAHARAALAQAWPPFVLVTGLLMLGQLAGADGLFDAAASRLDRIPGGPRWALLGCMALVALVTALLNLDTSAVFLTPVLIGVARRRGLTEAPFLYAAIFMSNASSLFLPGSNLTNLLVLAGRHGAGGASFFTTMLPAALIATLSTAAGLLALHWRALPDGAGAGRTANGREEREPRLGAGLLGVCLAAAAMVLLGDPALAVLAIALLLLGWRAARGELSPSRSLRAVGLPTLLGLFCLTVALGIAARSGLVPIGRLDGAGAAASAFLAAGASVLVNNLPAAVLLSSTGHLPVRALLIGLDVGPNLAVTGSLAVVLWWRAAVAVGARPSARTFTRQGLLLAPVAIGLALLSGI